VINTFELHECWTEFTELVDSIKKTCDGMRLVAW
jgi:hypothetical protein